jgi:hypothetical protein
MPPTSRLRRFEDLPRTVVAGAFATAAALFGLFGFANGLGILWAQADGWFRTGDWNAASLRDLAVVRDQGWWYANPLPPAAPAPSIDPGSEWVGMEKLRVAFLHLLDLLPASLTLVAEGCVFLFIAGWIANQAVRGRDDGASQS